jgi:hypothetical protein
MLLWPKASQIRSTLASGSTPTKRSEDQHRGTLLVALGVTAISEGRQVRSVAAADLVDTLHRGLVPAGGRPGGGLLVNVSRGIAGAALEEPSPGRPGDPGERLADAARGWARRLPLLR